jgi:hypothetical protein
VAPASPFARDEFDRGVAELTRLGFVPVYDDSVFATESAYLAGSAELRARTFMKYWSDPSVSALIAVRGGYGSVQMLPFLDPPTLVSTPKLFIGYSDNTSVLSWLTCGCGITAHHGPMLNGGGEAAPRYDEHRSGVDRRWTGVAGAQGLTFPCRSGPGTAGTVERSRSSSRRSAPFAFTPPDGCVFFSRTPTSAQQLDPPLTCFVSAA